MEALALLVIAGLVIWFYKASLARYFFTNLEYTCAFNRSDAYEGEEIHLVETVHNNKLLPVQWLKAEIFSSRWLDFANTRSTVAQENRHVTSSYSLRSYQKTVRNWNVKCLKRGVFIIDKITLAGGDFLGIATCTLPVDLYTRLVVYPGILDLEEMLVPTSTLQGDRVVQRWIIDDPFLVSGTREYTPRDSMNKIHWPATARQGDLMVRKNDFTSHRSLRIILNIQSMEFEYLHAIDKEMIEVGIKAAATLLEQAVKNGMPVGLASNGCTYDCINKPVLSGVASGKIQGAELLTLLAKLELRKVREFEDFLEDISGEVSNSEVVMITSFISNNVCHWIRRLKVQGNHIKVIFLGTYEKQCDPGRDAEVYQLPISYAASGERSAHAEGK